MNLPLSMDRAFDSRDSGKYFATVGAGDNSSKTHAPKLRGEISGNVPGDIRDPPEGPLRGPGAR